MFLAIKKLFTGEETEQAFNYSFAMDNDSDRQTPLYSDIQVTGKAFATGQGVFLDADVSFDYEVPCDRCAEIIKRSPRYHFVHQMVTELNHDEDYILVTEDLFDLDELIRSDILLELPTKNLCREDCKGLCPKCGANLNHGTCDCDLRVVDPRLEILKQLID